MPQIPTVPGSMRVNTPEVGVKADFNTLDQPNRGRAAVGQAVQRVGAGPVADYAFKLQEAKNLGIAADIDRQMRQKSADFRAGLVGRADEENWGREWNDEADKLWTSVNDTLPIAPALKRQLTDNWKGWKQSNAIEVGVLANKQAINRAVERVGLAADEAAKDGDENAIVGVFDAAVASEIMLPETAEGLKRQYLTKIDEYAAKTVIANNPAGAVAFLEARDDKGKPVNLKRLTPDQRLSLENTARVEFTKYQAANYDDLIKDAQSGVLKSPEQLTALVDDKVISARQRKTYESAYRHGTFNTSVDAIGGLFTEINLYDPNSDPSFTKRAALLGRVATSGFPQNVQSEMNKLLGDKIKPDSPFNTAIAKDAFEGIDQRFRLGLYGKYETKVPLPDGSFKTVVNAQEYEAAMLVKRRVEDATRKYIQQNPDATAEELNAHVSYVQMQNVVKAGRQTVLSGLGLTPATPEARKAKLDDILAKAKKEGK